MVVLCIFPNTFSSHFIVVFVKPFYANYLWGCKFWVWQKFCCL